MTEEKPLRADALRNRQRVLEVAQEVFATEGLADGTLYPLCDDPWEFGEVAFNTACWTYVHLRGRHHWTAELARDRVLTVVLRGLSAAPS